MKGFQRGFTLLMLMLLSGCALFQEVGTADMVIHDGHQEMVTTIKDHVEKTEELYDTIVIAAEDQILVSYKVHHLNRFKMKSIEKKLEKWLKEEYPDQTVELSSDYKIFLESHKLMTKWKNNEVTKEEAEKKLGEIVKLKNEMT